MLKRWTMFMDAHGNGNGAGAGVALEEVRAPRIEVPRDGDSNIRELVDWAGKITAQGNEIARVIKGNPMMEPEARLRLETEMTRWSEAAQKFEGFMKATGGRINFGESDEMVLDRANWILTSGGKGDDLPKMNRVYHNVMGLSADEVVGLAQIGQRLPDRHRLAGFTANPTLARSHAVVTRLQHLNDRLRIKDAILEAANADYRRKPVLERMRDLREWPEYEKLWGQLGRALNETNATEGGHLVPVIMSSQVGDRVEARVVVTSLFPVIPMTSKTYEWPFLNGAPTIYHYTEDTTNTLTAGHVQASQMSFAKPVWTAQILAGMIYVSEFVNEDAIEPVVDLAIDDLASRFGHAEDDGIVNGEYLADTMDGSAFNPANSVRQWTNGLRFHALETAGAPTLVNAAGALTIEDGVSVLEKMGDWGAGADVNDTVFIGNYRAWSNLLVVNSAASGGQFFESLQPDGALFRGQIGRFLGRPVVITPKVPLTHTDGKVSATGAENIKGSLLCVNRTRYAKGDRRVTTIDESRHIAFPKFQVAVRGSRRIDFQSMDSEVGATGSGELLAGKTPVGLIYNIT